jgi:hypothetical protein
MKYLKSILILSSLFVFSGSVQAVNFKHYNGSHCKTKDSLQAKNIRYYIGSIYNKSSESVEITCPIIVDETVSTRGTNRTYVYYKDKSRDTSNEKEFTCVLISKNGNTSIRQVKHAKRLGTGWLEIPRLKEESVYGSIVLSCILPTKGQITTISIAER